MRFALLAIAAGVVLTMMYTPISSIRGIRNNNPGNIRENERVDYDWEGEAFSDSDSEFEEFISPEYGIRAMARILRSYRDRGVVTMGDIIATWAPERENDTEAYIRSVGMATGMDASTVVMESDYPHLIAAIIKHENGINPYSMELIQYGVAMA